jgi:hypothetical protein
VNLWGPDLRRTQLNNVATLKGRPSLHHEVTHAANIDPVAGGQPLSGSLEEPLQVVFNFEEDIEEMKIAKSLTTNEAA